MQFFTEKKYQLYLLKITDLLILGVIYAQKSIDYEDRPSYKLTVKAQDKNSVKPLNDTCQVNITIQDLNDNIPTFPYKEIYVLENVKETIHKLIAKDLDSGLNAKTLFTLKNPTNMPFIVKTNGEISTSQELDREIKDSYRLKIEVKDQGTPSLSSIEYVLVQVQDVNDNVPQFVMKDFQCKVDENLQVGTHVCNVFATDMDLLNNKKIEYTFTTISNDIQINKVIKIYIAILPL